MTLAVLFALLLLSCVAAGGSLARLAEIEIRLPLLGFAAIAIQIVIVTLFPEGSPALHVASHLASYALAGGFLFANLQIPWLWLVGIGGLLNAAAIAANGGVMPASREALATAGMDVPAEFTNSTLILDAKLGFLGDVFAIPESWPLTNVFSPGDIVIAIGIALALHAICHSRLGLRQPDAAVRAFVARLMPSGAVARGGTA